MSTANIIILGLGRIGRTLIRNIFYRQLEKKINIVAIIDIVDIEQVVHLLKYDSTHGINTCDIRKKNQHTLCINQQSIHYYQDIASLEPHINYQDIDIMLECTGKYQNKQQLQPYLQYGIKKVLLSYPADNSVDDTLIYGINHMNIVNNARIISNGSCTTNCCVPVLSLLHQKYHILQGGMTTIHSAMNDQNVIDTYHDDLRLSRSCSESIIPVHTALAKGIARIIPELENKLESNAVRVPITNVTAIDLTLRLKKKADLTAIKTLFMTASQSQLKGILQYTEMPLVSIDFKQNPHSVIVDGTQMKLNNGHFIKLLIWCDNEWGFVNRMIDVSLFLVSLTKKKHTSFYNTHHDE